MRLRSLYWSLLGLMAALLTACAFVPRQVNLADLEGRVYYPRDSYSPAGRVVFGPFEDRRVNRDRLGVARNKLMMVTTTVSISGDLAGLVERMVRQNFAAQGIGEGSSPITVRGAVLEASTDAVGPSHIFIQIIASLTVMDSRSKIPLMHQTLRGKEITPVTQLTNEAWEDAFVGAMSQINEQIQAIAIAAAGALRAGTREGGPSASTLTGSCTVVHPEGLILTAHHVVEGAKQITVRLPDGRLLKATTVYMDPANDLSLLRVLEGGLSYLPLAPMRSTRVGQYVFTIGYPALSILGSDAKFTEGSISALSGPRGFASLLQISVPVQPGNSGGPIVNEAGELIGVITSTASVAKFLQETGALPQNINWAVKADYAYALFEPPPMPAPARNRAEAIERAMAAVCLIEATR